ncbi:MAG: TetR/AcrR family transcriptional regulator [Burkholderiaceae bacterium]|nr:TetR/AcrR family transcriptional regulator [Burkholderiaceae bacterium]
MQEKQLHLPALPESADHRHRVAAERRGRMRSRLLRSALRLIADKGPAATSIDDVICAAGVSRGTFYKYFPSPEALVRELAAEIANELVRITDSALYGHDDPAVMVARGLRLVASLAIRHPPVAGFLVRVGWSAQQGSNVLEFVRRDIEKGFELGRFKRMPLEMAANLVAGATLGAIQRMLETGGAEDFSEQAAAVALRALGVEPADIDAIASVPLDPDAIRLVGSLAETWINAV